MAPRAQQQRGQDRRDQLLDCAEDLFFRKGYEAASIHDLMQAAGVSKGAVYHHFKSKEEVLEAISVRLAEASAASVADIAADPTIDALAKLNRVFGAMRDRKAAEWPRFGGAFKTLFAPGNVALFHQVNQAMIRVIAPLLAGVLQEGIDQQRFRITDARAVAEMLVQLQGAVHPALVHAATLDGSVAADAGARLVDRRVRQIGIAMDRLLGLPDHTIELAAPSNEPFGL